MTIAELRNQSVVVLGYGINNRELVHYLAKHKVLLTIRDSKAELQTEFEAQYPELKEVVKWEILPEITEKLDAYAVIFRTPGISIDRLEKARKAGKVISSQTKLFFDLCPAEIIGVTGTKGKGTTSSLLNNMLQAGYREGKVYLAGNIGLDPFNFLEQLTADDLVILELSSFQISDLEVSPHVSIMLRVAADHLEHHGGLAGYRAAKMNLLRHQKEDDMAIINTDYPEMREFWKAAPGKRYGVSRHTPSRESAWAETLEGKEVVFFQMNNGIESFEISGRKLLGDHNLENILPAVLVAAYYKVPVPVMQKEIKEFAGLEHRLSHVGTYNGVAYYDDSIATTPESSMVAMEAFAGKRIHLVTGGRGEGVDLTAWAEKVVQSCVSVSLLPGPLHELLKRQLEVAIRKYSSKCLILDKTREPVMETLLSGIHPHLQEGDIVVLAPGVKSDTPYKNYKERGDDFAATVRKRYA